MMTIALLTFAICWLMMIGLLLPPTWPTLLSNEGKTEPWDYKRLLRILLISTLADLVFAPG